MLNFKRQTEILELVAEEFPAQIESTKKAMLLWPDLEDDPGHGGKVCQTSYTLSLALKSL